MTPESFDSAVAGCTYLFHVASPAFIETNDPEGELIAPAVQGRKNEGWLICFDYSNVFAVVYNQQGAAINQPLTCSLTGTLGTARPAGTTNVMEAAARCRGTTLRRVVLTSSLAAVHDALRAQPPLHGDLYCEEDWNAASEVHDTT